MQAILNVKLNEIDDKFLYILKELLSKNVEIVIRKEIIELEEFDQKMSLKNVINDFSKAGYTEDFINDLEDGFKSCKMGFIEKFNNRG
ncbi:conserved hypothetical protein [Desulfamplus magnetovallimortis]|uniref:Uncharacterized protein n=1 Tax=Desulfamplus magnetovallimortis TaxID=1246637 RepID=A0A1W1HBV7_9BACT|nr:hypothetical protein [Desulfamplus magnetovallimortis]SLM29865.1 conserved hypothetical protein [Desulfamplus magnetovallimortis]